MNIDVAIHAVTFLVVSIAVWAGIVWGKTMQLITYAKETYGIIRRTDKLILCISSVILLGNSLIGSIFNNIITTYPSALVILQVGIIFVMFYMHELQSKNLVRFSKKIVNS